MKTILVPLLIGLGGCSASTLHPPSLAPRAAEAIDPRLPVERAAQIRPANDALTRRLSALVHEAVLGEAAFQAALGPARRAASVAGKAQSESWITAQQLLSAVQTARGPASRAVAEVDAIAAEGVQSQGDVTADDQAAIRAAADEVNAIDQRQAAEVSALSERLGR